MAQTGKFKTQWFSALLLAASLLAGCDLRLNPSSLPVSIVNLPISQSPISFDDFWYDNRLQLVLVPAAETGTLALIDPVSKNTRLVDGFSGQPAGAGAAPVVGATSAAAAKGMVFALDQAAKKVVVVDPGLGKIISSAPTKDKPDLIRYVAATNEIWVTEKASAQIEVFSVNSGQPVSLKPSSVIPVPDGPEGLVIDGNRGLAFTNKPKTGMTAVIQVMTHGVIYEWGNGCSKARGLAIDSSQGFLFVACNEGKIVLMDMNNNGQQITSQNYGSGIDFIAYNPQLQHLYLPSGNSSIVAIFAVVETPAAPQPALTAPPASGGAGGQAAAATVAPTPGPKIALVRLGTADVGAKSHCIAADDHDNIWVCDPSRGRLFLIHDTFQAGE